MHTLPENNSVSIQDLARAINELIRNLSAIDPVINPNCGKIEPKAQYKRKGKLAYADNTNWNPGSGAGVYYYNGSSWVKLG